MQWDKYTIHTTTAAEDIIAAELWGLGVSGVEIKNHVGLSEEEIGDMFIDFPLDLGEDDGSSEVIFYLDSDKPTAEKEVLLKNVGTILKCISETCEIGSGVIESDTTEDLDWVNNWKQFFSSFQIGDLFIKPSWEEMPENVSFREMIEIDPGISFGTGKHETTSLCIEALQVYLQEGDTILDAGCGSGILSIAGVKFGAKRVFGLDIDENCITSSYENCARNGIGESKCTFLQCNLLEDADFVKFQDEIQTSCGMFDLIVANILADVLIPMLPRFAELLRKDGTLILSGIIDFKEAEVTAAVEAHGFAIREVKKKGEWVALCISFS